jgi:hypothetical protein
MFSLALECAFTMHKMQRDKAWKTSCQFEATAPARRGNRSHTRALYSTASTFSSTLTSDFTKSYLPSLNRRSNTSGGAGPGLSCALWLRH